MSVTVMNLPYRLVSTINAIQVLKIFYTPIYNLYQYSDETDRALIVL